MHEYEIEFELCRKCLFHGRFVVNFRGELIMITSEFASIEAAKTNLDILEFREDLEIDVSRRAELLEEIHKARFERYECDINTSIGEIVDFWNCAFLTAKHRRKDAKPFHSSLASDIHRFHDVQHGDIVSPWATIHVVM